MGTWGAGAFENDAASDWLMELTDATSTAPIRRAILRVQKIKAPNAVDLDDAIEALAAAEIIAAARGHPSAKFPDDLAAWMAARNFTPAEDLTESAIAAVTRIAANSELKSEWDGDGAWLREQDNLIKRLQKSPKAPLRTPPPSPVVVSQPAERATGNKLAALERALKKLKLRVHANGDGDAREIVPLDTPTIADAHMHLLAPLRTLEGVHLSDSKITDAAAGHFAGLTGLTWAWLRETAVGDRTAKALASAANRLRDLDLSETAITDRGVRHLARLGTLQILNLRGTKLSDRGVAHLAELKQLRSLLLGETKIIGSAFKKFAASARLERLDLGDTRMTDASVKDIAARFGRLDSLWLSNTRVTDTGVAHLVKLKRLSILDLDGTRITDASVAHLARLKRLRTLYVGGTRLTRAGINRLRKELSKTEIDFA